MNKINEMCEEKALLSSVGSHVVALQDVEMWFEEGKLHREGGPAKIWGDGSQYSEAEFDNLLGKRQLNKKLQFSLEEKPEKKK